MGMLSGLFGDGGSAKRAAGHAARIAREAGQRIEDRYQEVLPNYTPYIDAGVDAIGRYEGIAEGLPQYTDDINQFRGSLNPIVNQITSPDMEAFRQTPGYDFRFNEGMRGLENTAASRGGLLSSDAMDNAQRFGQDYATSEYDNYLNRLYNQLGAVGTQIQGAQAGQGSAMQNLNAEGMLLGYGSQAANQAAQTGMSAAQQQAAYDAGAGKTEASGMKAKAAQLRAAGDQWIDIGMTAAGAAAGVPTGGMGAGGVSSPFSGGMLSPQTTPWVNPDNINIAQSQMPMPWQNQNRQQGRQMRSQSSYM